MRAIATLMCLAAFAANAADSRFITTKGEAKVEVPPEFVKVAFSVLAIGKDLAKLKMDVDARTRAVLEATSALGVPGADIKSEGMQVTREYETDRNDNESLRGYRVIRDIEIKLRAMEKYEKLAQSLVDAGIDDIQGVEVDVDDRSALKQRAIVEATRNARREALAIATELDMTLGAPFEVSEDRLSTRHALRESTDERYEEIMVTAMRKNLEGSAVNVSTLVFRPHAIEVTSTVWTRFEIVPKAAP
jgi:uncharacterized protein YggE